MEQRADAKGTPLVIRGESQLQGNSGQVGADQELQSEISIDTVSITFDRKVIKTVTGRDTFNASCDVQACDGFQAVISDIFGSALTCETEVVNGINGFVNRIHFVDRLGFIAWGGNNVVTTSKGTEIREERFQVMVNGAGCGAVDWEHVADRCEELEKKGHDIRITRADIAADFHQGQKTVQDAIDAFHAGQFASSGRPPSGNLIDDLGSGEGCTLYVGKRGNGKLFRAYEKGKEQGDKTSPWVRYEVEFTNKDRVLPFAVLREPKAHIAGAYPFLAFISETVAVVKTQRLKEKISYEHLRFWAKRQYGKLINYASRAIGLTDAEIIREFINPVGMPDGLNYRGVIQDAITGQRYSSWRGAAGVH